MSSLLLFEPIPFPFVLLFSFPDGVLLLVFPEVFVLFPLDVDEFDVFPSDVLFFSGSAGFSCSAGFVGSCGFVFSLPLLLFVFSCFVYSFFGCSTALEAGSV